MIARKPQPLLLLLAPLLLPACFNDSGGGGGTETSTTAVTDSPGTTQPGGDTPATTTGTTAPDETTAEPPDTTVSPTSTSTTTVDPDPTTGEPGTSSTTTGGDNPGCAMYCAAMMSSCLDAHAQYTSLDSCLGACNGLPPGAPGETSGNSLACRAYHAGMASISPEVHCVHAGPGGAGACGQNCDGFCAIATATCPAEHPSVDGCLSDCAGFMDTEPYNTEDAAGDTLACRLYHLTIAATSPGDAEVHCGHTIAQSPPCK